MSLTKRVLWAATVSLAICSTLFREDEIVQPEQVVVDRGFHDVRWTLEQLYPAGERRDFVTKAVSPAMTLYKVKHESSDKKFTIRLEFAAALAKSYAQMKKFGLSYSHRRVEIELTPAGAESKSRVKLSVSEQQFDGLGLPRGDRKQLSAKGALQDLKGWLSFQGRLFGEPWKK